MSPYTPDALARRADAARAALRDLGLVALLVTRPENVTYLTGFTGDSSSALVTAGRVTLVSDDRFAGQIAGEVGPGIAVEMRGHDRTTLQLAAALLAGSAGGVGVEAGHLTLADFRRLGEAAPGVALAHTESLVERLREVKDAGEVAAIREAIGIAELAFAGFRAALRAEDTEKDLADRVELLVRQSGGLTTAFPAIVGVGARSALPHATPSPVVRAGHAPFLLLDWGAVGPALYRSDLTRVLSTPTWEGAARRAVEDRLRLAYTTVRDAHLAAVGALRPGATARDVDAAARAVIDASPFAGRFTHGLGHGIGLATHEGPFVRVSNTDALRAGTVLTVEPGVYVPDFGGVRLEDDYLITEDGCERLGALPTEWDAFFSP